MLTKGPAVGAVDPVDGLVGCTLQGDAAAISRGVGGGRNRSKLKVLVVNRDGA